MKRPPTLPKPVVGLFQLCVGPFQRGLDGSRRKNVRVRLSLLIVASLAAISPLAINLALRPTSQKQRGPEFSEELRNKGSDSNRGLNNSARPQPSGVQTEAQANDGYGGSGVSVGFQNSASGQSSSGSGVTVAFQNLTSGGGGSASGGVTVAFKNAGSGANDALSPGVSVAFESGPTPTPSPTPPPPTTPQRRPLIFVPGIAGSRLDDALGTKIWPPPDKLEFAKPTSPSGFTRISLDPSAFFASSSIVVPDVIRIYEQESDPAKSNIYSLFLSALTARGGYVEYQVTKPEMRTAGGCDLSQKANTPTLFVFAYDWRKSNEENAALLSSYVRCVQKLYDDNTDVDIVAHSQGGPLARRYLLNHPTSHHVKKFISIASPWLGAPKAINVLETGEFSDPSMPIYLKDYFIDPVKDFGTRRIFKYLTKYYPGEHELIPSRAYFKLAGSPSPYIFNNKSLSYDETVSLLDAQFSSSPGSRGRTFHDHSGQDDWSDPNNPVNTNVEYHHLYGVKTVKADTVGSVVERIIKSCPPLLPCVTLPPVFMVRPVEGDGTVPTLSALRDASLNAPGVSLSSGRIKVFRCPAHCDARDFLYDHTGLMNNADVQNEILNILQSPFAASPSAGAGSDEGLESVPVQPAYYFTVINIASAAIQNNNGNVTNPLADPPDTNTPEITSYVIGEQSFTSIIPTGQSYTISLRSGESPMAIELTQGDGVSTTQAIRYQDFSVPPNVNLQLQITPQGVGALRFDADGDGTFESAVEPKASVAGAVAQDTDPPVVKASGIVQGGSLLITLDASDNNSGVKATFFSLDGTNFQTYTAPFVVDAIRPPVVYAFADDNVANRSSLIAFYPSSTGNQIDNAQFFVRQHYLDFLNREPDASGLAFWTNEITKCGADTQCQEVKRVNVSAAFYLSIEFQETGYLAYRAYKAAYGNIQGKPVPITREEMLADMQQIGQGIVVGVGDWEQRLEQNKRDYFDQLAARERFTTLYPQSMTPEQLVDALNANAGGALSQAERDALVGDLKSGAKTRAQVLRAVAEDADLTRAETNKAFVLMQYFGYLRRNPDDVGFDGQPDPTFSGYNFWLSKLNQFNGNFVKAEMVKAFISSIEYRQRFSTN